MEAKIFYLETIQGIINRLANNAFLLKGWSVTLVAAVIALTTGTQKSYVLFAYFPAIIFWVLDAYYLSKERQYICLYNHVRSLDLTKIDFSLDTSLYRKKTNGWASSFLSKTLLLFHGSILVSILLIWILV